MIGKLTGRIDNVTLTQMIVDVQGVGYLVSCSARTLREAGSVGDPVSLLIETHVREDAISLFGFSEASERDWFRLLTTVQGVGAKVALAILSMFSPDELTTIIVSQDKAAMTRADSVGPKLALRLVTELKDKVAHIIIPQRTTSKSSDKISEVSGSLQIQDAVSALVNLGYRRAEAFDTVADVARGHPGAALDQLIRQSLAELGRKDSISKMGAA